MLDCSQLVLLSLLISITGIISLPITRMRVCVQSSDPTRLQSQCVYCHNRLFAATVRHCTANNYLPASMSVEEAFCLVRLCRRQTPAMRPEPFYPNGPPTAPGLGGLGGPGIGGPGLGGPAVDNLGPNDVDYAETEAIYADNQSSATTTSKRRPPASFTVGKPQRPSVRPFLFG